MRAIVDLPERLQKRIQVDQNGCWIWIGQREADGYGRTSFLHRNYRAHQLVYLMLIGPIEEGLQLDHLCRTRECCNPFHVEPVTQRENMRRGVGASARNARKTHCPGGHEYVEWNVYRFRGNRQCRTCRAIRSKERRAAEFAR